MYKHSNDNLKKTQFPFHCVSKLCISCPILLRKLRNPPTKTKSKHTKKYLSKHIYWYTVLHQDSEKKLRGCQNVNFSITFIGHDREQLFPFLFGTRQGSGSELVNVSIVPGGKSSFMTRRSEACHVDMEIKSEMTHNRHCLPLAKHYPSTKGNKKVEKIPCTSVKLLR